LQRLSPPDAEVVDPKMPDAERNRRRSEANADHN